jgi:hypothetical protein
MAALIATNCPHVTGNGDEITFAEKKEKTENVPKILTRPVTTVATEAGLAITNQVQP